MFKSLRLRLTLWYVGILAVILAGVCALVYLLVARSLGSAVDSSISQVSQQAIAAMPAATAASTPPATAGGHDQENEAGEGAGSDSGEHRRDADFTGVLSRSAFSGSAGVFLLAVDPQGQLLANPGNVPTAGIPDQGALATAARNGQDWRDVRAGGSHLRLLTVALPGGGYLVTGRSLDQRDSDLRRLLVLLVIGGVAGLALAAIGGLWVGELAIRPIRRSFDRQRDFIADASHELRTPIAVIRANAESLQGKVAPADREALQDIVDESGQVGKLIADLLTLAQADRVGLQLQAERVDLHEVVDGAARAGQRLAAGRPLSVEAHPEHVYVRGDPRRLRELALILVDNAIKYTESGSVVIASRRAGSDGVLTVSDSGIGIQPEHRPRLFDRFYRADKARSRAQGGVGLGLSIASAIVAAHGGRIDVDSEPGKGTTARVSLPLAAATPAVEVQPQHGSRSDDLAGRRGASGAGPLPPTLR